MHHKYYGKTKDWVPECCSSEFIISNYVKENDVQFERGAKI